MIFIFGTRRLGKIHEVGGWYVTTEFFCINGVPLFPLRTVVVRVDGSVRAVRLSPMSVLAGYLRAWSLLAVGVAAVALLLAHGVTTLVVGLVAATIAALSFAVGRLGASERARRIVYSACVGGPLDPRVLLDPDAAVLRDALRETIGARVPALAAGGYRTMPDPARDWALVARDPAVEDRDFLAAALTLARLDRRDDDHAAIWERLRALGVVDRAESAAARAAGIEGER